MDGQEKILAFDNKFHEQGTQKVYGVDCIITPFPIIAESGNKVILTLTEIELRQLLSSIQIGAEWAYPDQSQQILFNFMKGLICMSLCDEIADCIEDPESPSYLAVTGVSQNVTNTTIEQNNTVINTDRNLEPDEEGFIEKRFKSIDRDFPVAPPVDVCDNDAKDLIFGGTLEIVNRISEMALDFLEDVNTQADSVQRAARTVAIVPLIGDVAGETILAFAEVVPDILNLYLSHDSVAQHEDVACDLFCIHFDDCEYPTFDELINYYKSLGISGIGDIANVSMQALVDAIIGTNGLAASVVWYAMNTMVLYFLYAEGTFLGRRGTKWIKIYAENGALYPNNDWQILCDCVVFSNWTWLYSTAPCNYGLPVGWTLTISVGFCGVNVGLIRGLHNSSNNSGATSLIFTITPPIGVSIREIRYIGTCKTGGSATAQIAVGSHSETDTIDATATEYLQTMNETGAIVFTLQQSGASNNGVAVPYISINYL